MDLVGDKRGTAARRGAPTAAARFGRPDRRGRSRLRVRDQLARRPWIAPGLLAVGMGMAAVAVAIATGLPIRDPDGIFGKRMEWMVTAIGTFVTLDIVPRAVVRAGWSPRRLLSELWAVTRQRYSARRAALALTGVLSFYITYVAYRNLKSFLPFLLDQDLDRKLLTLERDIFFGNDPAILLHDLLGTGAAAYVLSSTYIFFLAFVPISVGVAAIWSRRYGAGFWYLMALGLNWTLGVATYYLLPAVGPVFAFPELYDSLPVTGVSQLQETLAEDRTLTLLAPHLTTGVQSIAAFASLHVSILFSAALIAHYLRLALLLRVALWLFLFLTLLSTVYFGWHYVVDDVAGLAIGAIAVYVGALTTGQRVRSENRGTEPPSQASALAT